MAREVAVKLVGDATALNRAFRSAGHSAKGFEKQATRTRRVAGAALKGIGLGAIAGGALIVKGLKDSVDAAMEAQKVQAQTAAVLKSTGGVAKVTAKHVETLANSISQKTGIDDEAIQASENLLLTFPKIRNEVGKGNNVFDQATRIVQDMSVALGQDAKSSVIQLGKALGDPIRGMTALRRVGVTFSEKQAKLITKLVQTGHILKAQKIVLAELRTEFGGSAKAAGQTFGGQINLLRVNVENLQERIGNLLLPVLNRWVRAINAWLSKAQNQRKVVHAVKEAVAVFSQVMRSAAHWIRVGARFARGFSNAVGGWANAAKIVIGGLLVMKLFKIAAALRLINIRAIRAGRSIGRMPQPGAGRGFGIGKKGLARAGLIGAAYTAAQIAAREVYGKDVGKDFSEGTARDVFVKGNPYPKGSPGFDAYRAGLRGARPSKAHTSAKDPAYQAGVKARQKQETHVHVHLDGKEVAKSTTKHQQRHDKRNGAQRAGRHGGRTR